MVPAIHTEVQFFVDHAHWATRDLHCVPKVGDVVRFNSDQHFEVKARMWPMEEDDRKKTGYCKISMIPIPFEN